jgi:hypothetical protein
MAARGKKYTLSKFYSAAKKTFHGQFSPRVEHIKCAVDIREISCGGVETTFCVTIFYTPTQSSDYGNFSGVGNTPEAAIEDAKREYNDRIEPFFSLVEDRTEI